VSIRRACSAVLLLLSIVGCGAGEVTLVVDRQSADVPRPGALRVLFQVLGVADPLKFDPVDVDSPDAPGRRFADIPPGEEIFADVFGCTSVEACGDADIVARGCSDRFVLEVGESRQVPVTLQLREDGLVRCETVAGIR
jgi:hypothetical protein